MSSYIFTLKNFRASDGNRTHNILINLTRYPSYSILIFINTCIYADSIFSNVSSIGPFVREKQKIKEFLFLSDEGPMLETLLSISAVHQPFYISICISTLPTQHTTFMCLAAVMAKLACMSGWTFRDVLRVVRRSF